jgi:NADPH-dependent glutamate synthase beta subunit-like oxidoreductase
MNFLEHEMDDIKSLGIEFKCNAPIEGKNGAENLLKDGYDAVFLAPGLWAASSIRTEGKDIDGLFSSVEYLAALRDGRFEEVERKIQGKTVTVIGGGSVAMDCVESAVRVGAKDVYLIYRRSYSQMPAEADERIDALESGVHYLLLNQPLDYVTDDQNRLTGLKLIRTRLGEPDTSGRRAPEAIEGSEWIMDADVVIEAIGNIARKPARLQLKEFLPAGISSVARPSWYRRYRTVKLQRRRSRSIWLNKVQRFRVQRFRWSERAEQP